MGSTITNMLRLVWFIIGLVVGFMELRSFYQRRKHLWNILCSLVRQVG